MSALDWVLTRLTPARHQRQIREARAEAAQAQEQLEQVRARAGRANRLWRELAAERVENHFQERVRRAYAGEEQP